MKPLQTVAQTNVVYSSWYLLDKHHFDKPKWIYIFWGNYPYQAPIVTSWRLSDDLLDTLHHVLCIFQVTDTYRQSTPRPDPSFTNFTVKDFTSSIHHLSADGPVELVNHLLWVWLYIYTRIYIIISSLFTSPFMGGNCLLSPFPAFSGRCLSPCVSNQSFPEYTQDKSPFANCSKNVQSVPSNHSFPY